MKHKSTTVLPMPLFRQTADVTSNLTFYINEFHLFQRPISHMADLAEGKQQCSICNEHYDYCFDLGFAHTKRFSDAEKEGKLGRYDCLRSGEFEFWHDTEFGFLDEKGFTRIYTHNMEHPPQLDDSILTELKRTPQMVTYQPDVWLTHCNDFMVYAGTWEPMDFYKNSASGDGRDLFMEMTDDEINHLWDESLKEGQTLLEEWHAAYYVFQCRHCFKLRGHWDCD